MDTLSAWSNGQWIHLDVAANRYFASPCQADPVLQAAQASMVSKLRPLGGRPAVMVPAAAVIARYGRCALRAWRIHQRPLQDQLAVLRANGGAAGLRRAGDVERWAWLYQHMRNLRPRRPKCLEDSVCCALFLRECGLSPSFRIGVMQPPFMAHAWVQVGNVIVNDTKGCVEAYSEILRLDL